MSCRNLSGRRFILMSESTELTAEQVKQTVASLRKLLAEIDPSASLVSRGTLNFGALGLSIIYGANAGNCGGGCFGCSACSGCTGCSDTSSSGLVGAGTELVNPNPVGARS
jgi:hypothetical protein